MSTNNKWQALSMKDRAFLIREAVRNGITDINSIRDTWEHRFDGESNQPTEDEYIAKQAQNKINKALHNARNAEDVPELWVEKNANMKTIDTFHYDNAKKELEDAKKELQKLSLRALQTNIYGQETFDNEMRRYELRSKIPELETTVRNYQKLCEQGLVPGFTCINTVTGYYDRPETWNVRFAKQHEQKGFKKIPYSEIAPGDIVQFKNSDNNPTHALMANTAYTPNSSDMRYNGSNGQSGKEALRINAKYPTEWDKVDAYRYVGNKADSLQWRKEYREKYGHQFSGEGMPYTTDSNNEKDSSFMEKLAYSIGSIPSAKDTGEGSFSDILEGIFNATINKDPYKYKDLKAFLGHPEEHGFKPSSDTRGPQFNAVISKYKDKNIKTYKGNINPFNEYVVTQEDYDKFFDMATKGKIFYSNADGEYVDYYYQGNPDSTLDKDTVYFINTPYRNDSHDYPIEFIIKDGNLYANAADFYDFSANKGDRLKKRIQSRLLTRYGKPYIVRQNMIPVRAIDLPEEFLELPTLDYKGNSYNMDLTEEQKRARNMHRNLEVFESKK